MTPDERRRIGSTDLDIPVTGLGTCPLGGMYATITDAEAADTFDAAWNAGMRLYDTAPWYGLGNAEHRTGRALFDKPRDEYVLTTKVGRVLRAPHHRSTYQPPVWKGALPFEVHHVFTYDAIMRSYEDSLQRLGINRIDALYIHDLDTGYFPSPKDLDAKFKELDDGGYRALEELKSSGEVKAIGAGINERGMIPRFLDGASLDVFFVASRYTLIEQDIYAEEMQPAGKAGASIVIGGAFNSGILATGARVGAKYEYGDAPAEVIERVKRLTQITEAHNVALPAAALQFTLAAPEVSSVVFGAVTASEVTENLANLAATIPTAFWTDLQSDGLLPEGIPVPKPVSP